MCAACCCCFCLPCCPAASPRLPELSSAELLKLKCLTLVSLASSTPSHSLPYSHLLSELDLPSQRDLESLVISAISSSLLSARLDQHRQLVEVDGCIGRDVAPGEVSDMRAAVALWLAHVDDVMLSLEQHSEQLRQTQYHASAASRKDDEERARLLRLLTSARSGQLTEPPKNGEIVAGVRVDSAVMQALQLVTGPGEGKAGKREPSSRLGAGGDKDRDREREVRGDKGRKRMSGWGFGRG